MAATFQGQTAGHNYDGGAITLGPPSGTAAGDLLVAIFYRYEDGGNSASTMTISGWTQRASSLAGGHWRMKVYSKTATGSEPSTYSLVYGSPGDGYGALALIHRIAGADTSSPFAAGPTITGSTSSSSSITAPAVTTTAANQLCLFGWVFEENGSDFTLTMPGGVTFAGGYPAPGGLSDAASGWQVIASAGSTGTKVATCSGSVAAQVGVSMAIKTGTVTGAAVQTITAGAVADARTNPSRAQATQTITAGAIAAGHVYRPPFPQGRLPIRVELQLGGDWEDVTEWTRGKSSEVPITITRGRTAEGAVTERSTCGLTFDNRLGDFSPRNPMGRWYGLLGRNTPVRVTITEGGPYLSVVANADSASCPDVAGLTIPGDLDVRVDLDATTWLGSGDMFGQYRTPATADRGWGLLTGDGYLSLYWGPTSGGFLSATATARVPRGGPGRLAVRATLDVDNGAGGWTATFWWANTIAGPWRQIGDPVTGAGVTTIRDSSQPLQVGDVGGLSTLAQWAMPGAYYSAELRSGIDGTVLASPDFRAQDFDATTFTDGQGNVWSFSGARLSNEHRRFVGEIPEWPQKWTKSGADAWATVQAAGILRRLGQGVSPLSSTYRRAVPALTPAPVAYWPCEEGQYATSIGSALGGPAMTVSTTAGLTKGRFAANTDFAASAALPTVEESVWVGSVPDYTPTGQTQLRFLIEIPTEGTLALDQAVVARLNTSGSIVKWDVQYGTVNSGSLRLVAYNSSGTAVLTTAWITGPVALKGSRARASLGLTESGADVNWEVVYGEAGGTVASAGTGTLTSATVGKVTSVEVNPAKQLGSTVIGHVSVEVAVTDFFALLPQLDAYRGETAGRRLERLCGEAGIPFVVVGDLDATVLMGYQLPKKLIDLLRESAVADGGILFEPRDIFGLGYRTRESLQRQDPTLALSYPGHQMSALEPVEDDLSTRNDVTVTRENGASARQVLESGPLSVQDVPDGIGRYDTNVTLSLATDTDALPQAQWRLHLGTVDEARYPTLSVNLSHPSFTSSPQLVHDVMSVDIGDRLTVTDPPLWVPPEDITQLVQGCQEQLGQFKHLITWNLAPESPYRVGIYGDPLSRYAPDGSTLAADVNTTATTLSIATPAGPLWSHVDGNFDVLISGERMTVSAVTGSSSPQSFTVVRSVNGVVKAHVAGEAVTLAEPVWYSL